MVKTIIEGSLAAIVLYLILTHGSVAVQLANSGFSGLTTYAKALQGR